MKMLHDGQENPSRAKLDHYRECSLFSFKLLPTPCDQMMTFSLVRPNSLEVGLLSFSCGTIVMSLLWNPGLDRD